MPEKVVQVFVEIPSTEWQKAAILLTSFGDFHVEEGHNPIEEISEFYERTLKLIEKAEALTKEYELEEEQPIFVFKKSEKRLSFEGSISEILDSIEKDLERIENLAKQYYKHKMVLEKLLEEPGNKAALTKFIEEHKELFEKTGDLRYMDVQTGIISSENFEELGRAASFAAIEDLGVELSDSYTLIAIVSPKAYKEKLNELLEIYEFIPLELIVNIPITTKPILDALNIVKTVLSVAMHMELEDSTLKIRGFIPLKKFDDFKKYLEENFSQINVYTKKTEEAPSILKGPFSKIMAMAGVPEYHEVDPTPIFNITFPLFFGMMFGDIGHGLVLAILGVLLRKFSPSRSRREWGTVLLFFGISSMFFGILAAEMFGIPLGYKPIYTIFGEHHEVDANKIMIMLGLCMLIGIIHISIGYVAKIINLLREGERGEALLFFLPLLIFYLSGVVVIGSTPYGGSVFTPEMGNIALYTLTGSVLVMLLGRPLKLLHNLMEFFLSSLELGANTISYARLILMFMVHTFLMKAVNMALYLGVAGMPIVLIGNIGVIALEGMMAYIQTMRLHFYEFFTKFFKGTGKAFKPIILDAENAILTFRIGSFTARLP